MIWTTAKYLHFSDHQSLFLEFWSYIKFILHMYDSCVDMFVQTSC